MKTTEIKEAVKKAYSNVLTKKSSSCCSTDCCGPDNSISEDYRRIEGYVKEADYGLGCGIPVKFAGIKEDDIVLDLGSGAGNDVFIAGKIVGRKGKVVGLDMTEAMIEKAQTNKKMLGADNVEFILGEIENIPLDNESIDVILSNCVLNLVPDKVKAFREIYRVLKTSGHFTISDIVFSGDIPEKIKKAAELSMGCISGAINKKDYLKIIDSLGFKNINIFAEKTISLPDTKMLKYISVEELTHYKKNENTILSITIGGSK